MEREVSRYDGSCMLVYDLDGNESKWKLNGKEVVMDARARSSLHKAARVLLRERFPTLQLLEETPVKVHKGKTLYLDFYFPLRKLAIEVHGQQHFKYNTHFHASPQDFLKQRKNDNEKAEWCELNSIELITLSFDDVDNWGDLL